MMRTDVHIDSYPLVIHTEYDFSIAVLVQHAADET